MVKNLENYPEWKDKVVEEIGKWFHLIHNNLSESDAKRIIFEKMVLSPSIIGSSCFLCLIHFDPYSNTYHL